jgi:hypothetical protein
MSETEQPSEQAGLNKTWLAAAVMAVGGVLTGLVAVFWGLARLVELSRADEFSLAGLLAALALMFVGVSVGLLLWGVAELLRKLDAVIGGLPMRASADGPPGEAYRPIRYPEPPNAGMNEVKASLAELIALTREVRDIGLLSEGERSRRVQVQGRALVAELQEEIPALLKEHQWFEARRRVQQGRERFPSFAEWDVLDGQIEQMRATVEARDVAAAARQVDDLTSLGALDRAMTVVRDLLDRHPSSSQAQELARRVTIQREKRHAEARARLMAQAQEAVHRRDWNLALRTANELIRRFPRSAEAEALRQQLPMLTENAEIQTRQQMEAEFRQLVQARRLDEALRLAHELIERYPSSPQAEALRGQLPKLEERLAAR